jgi:hypothetical protein
MQVRYQTAPLPDFVRLLIFHRGITALLNIRISSIFVKRKASPLSSLRGCFLGLYTAYLLIQEVNRLADIDFGQEGYGHDVIDGVGVKWSSAPVPDKNKASDIRFCQFFWNRGNTGFTATIYGFPQSEATKVVTSMIRSGAS